MNKKEDGFYMQKGYLNEDFLFFHLKDQQIFNIAMHYHAFHKLIVFCSGDVTYCIEGKSYKLRPGDLLFIANDSLHKPIISASSTYERIILWINPKYTLPEYHLLKCFDPITGDTSHLLRLSSEKKRHIDYLLSLLERAYKDKEPGNKLLQTACFHQLLVWLNRYLEDPILPSLTLDIHYNPRIQKLIDYINGHLTENLGIEQLAQQFYLNKHYLMHYFKSQTGYTLHQYIQKKRLIKASHLLQQGDSIHSICLDCGFGDYSSFARAFKKEFSLSPRHYLLQYKSY